MPRLQALRVLALALPAVMPLPCEVHTLNPTSGPLLGGTLVNLTGAGLGDGSAWRCAFGSTLVSSPLVTGAEYDDEYEHVSCFSPPGDAGEQKSLNVSIDGGSSWCAGASLQYSYYAPPNVSSISPASGSARGGTVVTVSGSGFAALGSAACAFGTLRVGDEVRAGAVVAAAGVSDGVLECVSPSADEADAVGSVSFSFRAASMPAPAVVQGCEGPDGVGLDDCTPGEEPERRYRFAGGHNLTLLGKCVSETA